MREHFVHAKARSKSSQKYA